MEYRKLIKFGSNSYVISLPKKWLEKYELEKGSIISLETVGDSLIISPEQELPKEEKIISIDVGLHANKKNLKRELLSAYEHNATTIVFGGKAISEYIQTITRLIDTLTGLELVEHTKERIVAKTYIKTDDIEIESFLKRIDNSIKSMMLEIAEDITQSDDKKLRERIRERENNVDKITRLLQRIIRERLYKQTTQAKENQPLLLLRFYLIIQFLEQFSDNLETITNKYEAMEITENNNVEEMIIKLKSCFEKVMNAFYKNNKQQAYEISESIHAIQNEIAKKKYNTLLQIIEENTRTLSEINKLSY